MNRTILHIDMNAFFASVEQQANPSLRGKPIAVIGSGARTIITTCSYEARAYGVKTGMNLYEARGLCPELILVVGNNRKYTHTSSGIVEIFRDYSPLVEVFSIDESFLDVTSCLRLFGSAERISWLIKARIRHRYGITCSVGIAPNKILAKLASEMHKPDGLTIIPPERVGEVLEELPVGELCGVGRRTREKLELLGITTCGQLGRASRRMLKKRFGIVGEKLHDMGNGIDESPVTPSTEQDEVKSVGHSMTLPQDVESRADICRYLLRLSEMVGRRARRYGARGRTVHLTLRYSDFETIGSQLSIGEPTNLSDVIYRSATTLLGRLSLHLPVRLLGVRLTSLTYQQRQYRLFDEDLRKQCVAEAMDSVNDRHGSFTVSFASILDSERAARVISPAWRPEGIRYVNVE